MSKLLIYLGLRHQQIESLFLRQLILNMQPHQPPPILLHLHLLQFFLRQVFLIGHFLPIFKLQFPLYQFQEKTCVICTLCIWLMILQKTQHRHRFEEMAFEFMLVSIYSLISLWTEEFIVE